MPSKLKSRLLTFFRPLLRALGMSSSLGPQSSTSPPFHLLDTKLQTGVETYTQYITTAYEARDPSFPKSLRVTQLDLVKQVVKSEHEYMVAWVQALDGFTQYLSFERAGIAAQLEDQHPSSSLLSFRPSRSDTALAHPRRVTAPVPGTSRLGQDDLSLPAQHDIPISPPTPDIPLSHSSTSAPPHDAASADLRPHTTKHRLSSSTSSPFTSSSSSSNIASLDSLSRQGDARDTVSGHAKPTQTPYDIVIGTLSLSSLDPPLLLHELAVLAQTVHTSATTYKLFSTNCYWFCGMMMNAVEARAGVEMELIDVKVSASRALLPYHVYRSLRARLTGQQKGGKNGTWKWLRVYTPLPDAKAKILRKEWEKDLATFETELEERRQALGKEAAEKLKHAERATEMERKLKEDAERATAMERKFKEDAEDAVEKFKEAAEDAVEKLKEAAERDRQVAAERERILLEKLARFQSQAPA
ncbi:hypothetical protein FPV67DRAFT_1780824 [Lyophyllum atratum]|nr:hypothetical protein FPV67DRAFT_1780824 [Lyophyllum atratum]